jgi:hypothetical protein
MNFVFPYLFLQLTTQGFVAVLLLEGVHAHNMNWGLFVVLSAKNCAKVEYTSKCFVRNYN